MAGSDRMALRVLYLIFALAVLLLESGPAVEVALQGAGDGGVIGIREGYWSDA